MNDSDPSETCPACEKPAGLCICEAVSPVENRIEVLILRHPQEQDRILGTARIAELQLRKCAVKTGLSWPNLAKAVGRPADPKRWGVLYLGTVVNSGTGANRKPAVIAPLSIVDDKGLSIEDQAAALKRLEGIILLDGNWQQAKALWWRNAWMLKCRRLVLRPRAPSLYGNLRREPRAESVSTIEAAALTLAELEGKPGSAGRILAPFELLLEKARGGGEKPQAPAGTEKRWGS